jgi:ribose transport system substrate-binding protein
VDPTIPATDVGLNEPIALALAQGENLVGVGIDAPYDEGILVADTVGLGLLDRPAPAYTIVPASTVTRESLAQGRQDAYGVDLPTSVEDALEEG